MYATKQIIVMRNDLNMRKGKMVAQGAHASLGVFTEHMKLSRRMDGTYGTVLLTAEMAEWLEGSFAKVCVRCDSLEEMLSLHAKAKEANIPTILINDNGTTEFGGVVTPTCIAIGPAKSEDVDAITGHLRLL